MKKLIIISILTLTQLFAVSYQFNDLNQLTKATYADGTVLNYDYDDAGNLLYVRSGVVELDTDGDGISDIKEQALGLKPNNPDTDGDGISDLEEVGDINNPRDSDGDGIIDALELDSDNDGVSDADEIKAGTDPRDKNSYPPSQNIVNFVKRFYLEVLSREADIDGLNSWVVDLKSGAKTGSDIAKGFVFSEEFVNKKFSDIDFLNILYKAFFNREADIGGLNGWLYQLERGVNRAEVLDGFLGSQEFKNLADKYGIIAISTPVEDFVTRFYVQCLDRNPDSNGLHNWVTELKNGTKTGADVARGFVWSTEFIDKALDNSAYLGVLYKAFFDRQPDKHGYDYWMNDLSFGMPREQVLEGFLGAQEFINLSNDYGIKPF